MSAAISD